MYTYTRAVQDWIHGLPTKGSGGNPIFKIWIQRGPIYGLAQLGTCFTSRIPIMQRGQPVAFQSIGS